MGYVDEYYSKWATNQPAVLNKGLKSVSVIEDLHTLGECNAKDPDH